MKKNKSFPRRAALKGFTAAGALSVIGHKSASGKSAGNEVLTGRNDVRETIFRKVFATPLIDTHEHLIEEKARFMGTKHPRVRCDDWTLVLSHYLNSDMITAGMPKEAYDRFFSPEVEPADKWSLIEPIWQAVKNTGYGQAVVIALQQLYGVDGLSAKTVQQVQAGYEAVRKPGFYDTILRDHANIMSCQVNSLEGTPFMETDMPLLLMQDISIVGMFSGPDFKGFGGPAGIEVRALDDWHRVIDWWFAKYGKYAVAVKSQDAYARDINYEQVPAEKVESIFTKRLNRHSVSAAEKKALEDHLFWYAVEAATKAGLPVKLHTGYYAGSNSMPLSRLINNPGSATDLCRVAPDTRFVFMHICYPYYEELISVAKQYTNAYIDMCWAWIINPVAAKDFLKKYLVTAPANKIVTFGGDYIPVEPVLGHAAVARRGIALALAELVEEGWYAMDDAMIVCDMVMHGNARKIFDLDRKEKALAAAPWKR